MLNYLSDIPNELLHGQKKTTLLTKALNKKTMY